MAESVQNDVIRSLIDSIFKSQLENSSQIFVRTMVLSKAFYDIGTLYCRSNFRKLEISQDKQTFNVICSDLNSMPVFQMNLSSIEKTLKVLKFIHENGRRLTHVDISRASFICSSSMAIHYLKSFKGLHSLVLYSDCICDNCPTLINPEVDHINNASAPALLSFNASSSLENVSVSIRSIKGALELLRTRLITNSACEIFDYEVIDSFLFNGGSVKNLRLLDSNIHPIGKYLLQKILISLNVKSLLLDFTVREGVPSWDLAFASRTGDLMESFTYWETTNGRIEIDNVTLYSQEEIMSEVGFVRNVKHLSRFFHTAHPIRVVYKGFEAPQALREKLLEFRRVFLRDYDNTRVAVELNVRIGTAALDKKVPREEHCHQIVEDFGQFIRKSYIEYGYFDVIIDRNCQWKCLKMTIVGFNRYIKVVVYFVDHPQ